MIATVINLALIALGIIIGAVGILVWNKLSPNKVAKFTAKYQAEIEQELKKLKKKAG